MIELEKMYQMLAKSMWQWYSYNGRIVVVRILPKKLDWGDT